jgi:hypothetical protein
MFPHCRERGIAVMGTRARVRRTTCGRWAVEGQCDERVVLPTEALARDYARALEAERGWWDRASDHATLVLSTVVATAAGAGVVVNFLLDGSLTTSPVTFAAGAVLLVVRLMASMRG